MTDTTINFPEAASRLGVALRVLRAAIRAGKIPAPAQNTATASLSAAWLASAAAAVKASPTALNRVSRQKVPAFARYEGTSAWRKYSRRVRDYNHFQTTAG
ncbi:MAG: hypothetical protein POG74_03600 [Acidocella sp.]|nr:hypothetical protein [Acidocella sp.]